MLKNAARTPKADPTPNELLIEAAASCADIARIREGFLRQAVKALLDGADPEARAADGCTALMLAAGNANTELAATLVKKCDLSAKDPQGLQALDHALSIFFRPDEDERVPAALATLEIIAAHAKPTPKQALALALAGSQGDSVYLLECAKAAANVKIEDWADEFGRSALSHAAMHGSEEAARWLIDAGADVESQDEHAMRPLMYAAVDWVGRGEKQAEKAAIARELLARCDPNAKGPSGKTAMILAVERGTHTSVKALAEHKAIDMLARDDEGKNALEWAILANRDDLAEAVFDRFNWLSPGEAERAALLLAVRVGEASSHGSIQKKLGIVGMMVSRMPPQEALEASVALAARWLPAAAPALEAALAHLQIGAEIGRAPSPAPAEPDAAGSEARSAKAKAKRAPRV
jgi:ankyrin repeat protein